MHSRTLHPGSTLPFIAIALLAVTLSATAGSPQTTQKGKKKTMTQAHEVAVIETSMGTIEAELYRADAPKTVENFVGLAGKKYFDGIIFHRVVPGFVIQGGDPTGTGTGGESIWKKEFADELNPATPSYKAGYMKGVLAMANRGPNTNTSQFFIMLADNTTLPKNYSIFGKVIKGMDVVDAIGKVPLEGGSRPVTPVVMKSVRIRTAEAAPKKK
ncbi:MAG TPA: peptidylprolyl isomerase [Bacteroidota bacterium]|nr:peptidylprolyl isomerase [Bacteroidota bacterium]